MNIYEKLNSIQSELKVNKNQTNAFGRYQYRSLEDIQKGVKPLLKEHKCCITLSDEIVMIGDRFYNKSTASLIDIENSESVEVTAMAREPLSRKGMDESQITVATSSYSRKSAMNGLLAIDDNRDPDVTTQDEEPNKRVETLSSFLKQHDVKAKDFVSHFMIQAKQAKELLTDKPKLENMVKEYKQILANNAT